MSFVRHGPWSRPGWQCNFSIKWRESMRIELIPIPNISMGYKPIRYDHGTKLIILIERVANKKAQE